MKPWTAWLARLGLAGTCVVWAGCGGGSKVATPESGAATEETVPGGAAEAAPAAADAAAAPAVKGEAGSTAEMLAMANGPAPEAEKPAAAEGAAAPSAAPGMPGATSGMTGYPTPPGVNPAGTAKMPGMPGMGSGYPGMAGMAGMGGPGGGANARADFRTPAGAVMTFLNALRAKDPERLAEATAQRAATESTGNYQKVFVAILEQSLAAEDLAELAAKFEGAQITSMNPPKSSAKAEVIVGKLGPSGQTITRKITVRKEKAGWKVLDIAKAIEGEKPFNVRGGGTGKRR